MKISARGGMNGRETTGRTEGERRREKRRVVESESGGSEAKRTEKRR